MERSGSLGTYCHSKRAEQSLINALKDKEIMNIVSLELNYSESETAVQLLIDALKNEDLDVSDVVARTLGNICSSIFKRADSFSYCSEFKKKSESVVQLYPIQI